MTPSAAPLPPAGSDHETDRLHRAALSAVGEPGHPAMARLVAAHGAETVLAALTRRTGAAADLGADVAARLATVDPERDLEEAARRGIRFLIPGDPEWPARLDDLARAPVLNNRGGPPVGLWVRGPMRLDEVVTRAVAVVGSRSATSYGGECAGAVAAGLARTGHTVVSGGAFGIDQAAHRAALASDGVTIAVLAGGLDRFYPATAAPLLERVAETALVLSETPLGGAPTRIRFLARNRLIAALSSGTVVVEAAIRSGALNTASWASGMGRVLMGVPGPVTSATSQGVHQMIRNRDALLVTCAEEVVEAVAPIGEQLLLPLREEPRARDRLTGHQQQVLDAVPVASPAPVERIARAAGLRVSTVAGALRHLEEAGHVQQSLGRWHLSLHRPAGGAAPVRDGAAP
ncbi:MAG: DNA-processing protein DprA [Marmoricola sp.]